MLELSLEQRHACLASAMAQAASELSFSQPDEVWDARIDELYQEHCLQTQALMAADVAERERLWVEAVARVCDDTAAFYAALANRCRRRGAMLSVRHEQAPATERSRT
jgi:hypothetical protein